MSERKRILITGATGLLGSNCTFLLSKKYDVLATSRRHAHLKDIKTAPFDIAVSTNNQIIRQYKPSIIINCAALTNVDYCEDSVDEAKAINAVGPRNLARLAAELGAHLIHISSDSVFDGSGDRFFTEADAPCPINQYGLSKLEGDLAVENSGCAYTVLRTTIYGFNALDKLSLGEWMLRELSEERVIGGFEDIMFTPMLVNNLVQIIEESFIQQHFGTYHIASEDSVSKYEFGLRLARTFGLNEQLITARSSDTVNFKAKRQKNMCLDAKKAQSYFKTPLLTVDQSLMLFHDLYVSGYAHNLKRILTPSENAVT
ncbi:MAG: hypothetical protein CMF48_00685 [Legionellales bacterium]|nr:hypothetical protein [Legionellales bacterium]|tara:strand:- start:319 stop:1263 length:945 start_codon:yes stop_codon:yes gene_type:complete